MIHFLLWCALANYRAPLVNKVDPRCFTNEVVRAWVYFTDKGISEEELPEALNVVKQRMNSSSLMRRNLRNSTIDYADIPVNDDYIEEIERCGGLLLYRSKWLNAASFLIAREDLEEIAQLEFVYKITPIAKFKRIEELEMKITQQDTSLHTTKQLAMFHIDSLHRLGVYGTNVKVGFLDTGLKRRHAALESIKVIAEYDFLGGDQAFMDEIPVCNKSGTYSSIVFHNKTARIELFLIGDTTYMHQPTRDVLYTYSTDNGNTWSEIKKLTENFNSWANELTICGRDTVFLFYRDRNGIKYLVMDTTVIVQPAAVAGLGYREPTAVMYDDTVYLFYQNRNRLYFKKGTINGFFNELTVDTSSGNIKIPKAIVGKAKIGLFYYNLPGDSIFFLWDSIPLIGFAKKFIGVRGKDPEAIACNDTIFLIYKDVGPASSLRLGFMKSVDFGKNFSSPVFLSDSLNSIGKISIAKSGGSIMVSWESEGKVYFCTSSDNGNNFSNLDSLNKEFVYLPTLGLVGQQFKTFYCARGDNNTDDTTGHSRHGTEMLGLVGGYAYGYYTGVAPGAQFIVAKTENPDSVYEFPVEEDTWIAGLEWAEAKGADIISSSLGYTNWYVWPYDYDGKTAPTSIAAYEATKRGVIVVTAAGNVAIPQLVVPGDAMGAITVGGIDTLFTRWEYSGYGPTYDGRIKPEIVCLAAAPIVINPDSVNDYLYSFGTSGATAMVSGICALLLEGHPRWNVDSVRNALFMTASFADSASQSLGYGWPDAVKAFYYTTPEYNPVAKCGFLTPFPNPFVAKQHNYIYLPFFLNTKTDVQFSIYSISGRLIKRKDFWRRSPGRYTDTDPASPNAAFIWDGKDESGNYVASGLYYCLMYTYGFGNDMTKIVVVR